MKFPKIKDRELHRITSTAIIYKDGKFLITQRNFQKKVFPGKWTVPGGGLTIDDYINKKSVVKDTVWYFALEDALRREINEETGLAIGKIDYLLDLAIIRGAVQPSLVLSFYAPWKKGKVRLSPEDINFAWVTAKEAEKYDLIGGILEEITMVDAILKGKRIDKARFFK